MWACALALLLQLLPLRFAWLSDLHVGSPDGEDALREVITHLNDRTDIRFVLISGDITEMGTTEELTKAHRTLSTLGHPYYIIPGNHDTKWSPSGGTAFARIFGSTRFVARYGNCTFLGFGQGPLMRMADGHCAPEDLRWVDSVLASEHVAGSHGILVCHYPVDSSISNWHALLDRLDAHDVRFILAGHGHRNSVISSEGFPGLMGRAVTTDPERSPGYNIVAVSNDSLTVLEVCTHGPAVSPWYSGVLAPVRHITSAALRPDYSVNARYPDVRVQWRWNSGYTIAAAPAVAGNMVIVCDASGAIHALDAGDGTLLWSYRTGGPVLAAPCIGSDRVVVSSTDSNVYCLHLADGSLAWRSKQDAEVVAAPLVADSVVYVGGSDGGFRALDLFTGRLHWQHDGFGGFIETRPALHNGRVFVGAWDEHMCALDAGNGDLCWRWRGPRQGRHFSPAACWPVALRGKLYFVAPDRAFTVLDCRDGSLLWRTSSYKVRESIGVTADSALVILRTMNDSLVALDARSDPPRQVWVSTPGFGYDINAAMPVEKDGKLMYGTMKGFIFALDSKDGGLLWVHRASNVAVNTLAPISKNRVVMTDFDGNVALIQSNEK